MEHIQFAILLGWIGLWILDEFTHQRQGEAVVGDELGLQRIVIVGRHPVVLARQTVLAVALREAINARPVNGDDVVTIEQAIAFEDLFANQDFDQSGDTLLDLRWRDVFESVIDGVAVRRALDSEQSREVGR